MSNTGANPPFWTRDEPESPCVNICVIHPRANICTGCFRTLEEIADWGAMSAEDRREIMAELPARAPLLKQRQGGRKARLDRAKDETPPK